jgi:hypothetical protein
MSRSTYSLKLPASVKTAAARLAKTDGVSLNQFSAAGALLDLLEFRLDVVKKLH